MNIGFRPPPEADLLLILTELIARSDPQKTTNAEFQRELEAALAKYDQELPAPLIYYDAPDQLFFSGPTHSRVYRALERVTVAPIRDTIAFLEEVIERREERDDLWPDGRLQLGIAYAAIGEYKQARRVLEEVINICETGGRYMVEAEA